MEASIGNMDTIVQQFDSLKAAVLGLQQISRENLKTSQAVEEKINNELQPSIQSLSNRVSSLEANQTNMIKAESQSTIRHGYNSPFVLANEAPAPQSPPHGNAPSARTLADSRCMR
eukprot:10719512-Prorocentrum_lima.AAC.1